MTKKFFVVNNSGVIYNENRACVGKVIIPVNEKMEYDEVTARALVQDAKGQLSLMEAEAIIHKPVKEEKIKKPEPKPVNYSKMKGSLASKSK